MTRIVTCPKLRSPLGWAHIQSSHNRKHRSDSHEFSVSIYIRVYCSIYAGVPSPHKRHTPKLIAAISWLRVYVVRSLRPTTKETSSGELKYFSQFKGLSRDVPNSLVQFEPTVTDEDWPSASVVSSMDFSLIQLWPVFAFTLLPTRDR